MRFICFRSGCRVMAKVFSCYCLFVIKAFIFCTGYSEPLSCFINTYRYKYLFWLERFPLSSDFLICLCVCVCEMCLQLFGQLPHFLVLLAPLLCLQLLPDGMYCYSLCVCVYVCGNKHIDVCAHVCVCVCVCVCEQTERCVCTCVCVCVCVYVGTYT